MVAVASLIFSAEHLMGGCWVVIWCWLQQIIFTRHIINP